MANQNQNRGMQTRSQTQNRPANRQGQQGQPQTYYSYSYGYGYYDPVTGDWITEIYGPYGGVGPGNYKRSDDRIQEDINDLFWIDGNLDASDIEVDVKNGEATLKGTVQDRRMKRLAEDLAYSVPGVNDVQNQLRIKQPQGRQLGQGQQGQQGQSAQGNQSQRGQTGQGENFKSQLKPGFKVLDTKGNLLGTIKEIHDYDFLVDRPSAPDVHLPFSTINDVRNNTVDLNITFEQMDKMHFATSPKEKAGAH